MYNTYIKTLLGGRGFQLMHEADTGAGAGGTGGSDDAGDDKGSGAGDQTTNSLDELLKDPTFKAQYTAKLQEQLGSRLKKYEGVDLEEYNRLKKLEEDKANAELTEAQKLQKKVEAYEAKQAQYENKDREFAVKEYLIDNNLDVKLISRLIEKSGIKRSEDGESFEGIKEAVEKVAVDFPQLFPTGDDGEDDKSSNPRFKLPKQKGNPDTKKDPREAGRQRALARHGKKE